jgi:shikimate dehydrogenase
VPGADVAAADFEELEAEADAAAVLVNGTSVGLPGHEGRLPPLRLRADQAVLDFVYGDTELARAARAAGARLITGEQVLVRQGALAFTIWTGLPAPEADMARALEAREGAR